MARKKNRRRKEKSEIGRTRQTPGGTRNAAIRKMRATPKVKVKAKAQMAKAAPKPVSQQKSAGVNRSEGIRLFKLAGRPSKADFVTVYGPNGPRLTWEQRTAAGVPAEKFQAALAAKLTHT
jgi:hypothetical protein